MIRPAVQIIIPEKLIPVFTARENDTVNAFAEEIQQKTAKKYQSIFFTSILFNIITIQATTFEKLKFVSIYSLIK